MKTKILSLIAEFIRKHNFCQNIGKFKIGDKVTYNWRAKYHLLQSIDFDQVFEVSGDYENGEGVTTKCGHYIWAHWLRKI